MTVSNPATFARFKFWPRLAIVFALPFAIAAAWALAGPAQANETTKPERPSGLRISTQQGSLNVALSWNDVTGETHYLVRWRHVDTREKLNKGIEVQVSAANITLADYGEWVVRVQACNDAGCGPPLAKQFRVDPAPPPTPTPTPSPTPSPTPTPIPLPPTWATTGTTGQLPENDTAESLLDLRATDPDGDDSQISYTITAGDTAKFSLTAQQSGTNRYVSLDYAGAAQDFEGLSNPATFATVTVRATDASGLTVDRTVTISVTDVNDAPIFSAGDSVTLTLPENSGDDVDAGAPISATDQDGNTLTYSLGGDDAASFEIDPNTGQISTTDTTYDFETDSDYDLTVTVSDGTITDTIAVTIDLTDVNDAPVFSDGDSATRSLPENSTANVSVGAPFSASDQDGDTFTYSFSGADAASFTFDPATGQISTKAGVTYDFETKPAYSVTVTVSDGTITDTIAVTVDLTDVNDAPVFSGGDSVTLTLPENSGDDVDAGAPITATDQDGNTLTYSLGGDDAGSFEIDPNTGQISTTDTTYDFETDSDYDLTVTVSDGTITDTIAVTIDLTDVNDAPVFSDGDSATRSLPENSTANVSVGAPFSASDQDGDTFTYSFSGADAASFTFDPATGQISTKAGVTYDFETKPAYSVTVTATDDGDPVASSSIPVTVNLTNVNEPPAFSAETYAFSVSEDAANFKIVGVVAAIDPDAGANLAHSITAGNTGGRFTIVRNTGDIVVWGALDFVTKSTYTLTVKAIEDGNPAHADTTTVTVNVFSAIDRYRQVRTWTGRNLENDTDVTLTTYSSWSTTSPPSNAPDITSETTTETRDDDNKIRKTITWSDGTNNAYQRTDWYAPTRTETYTVTVYYDATQYRWKGAFFIQLPGWTPENPNENWDVRYTYGRWSYRNPPPEAPYPHLETGETITNPSPTEELQTRTVKLSRQEERTRTVTVTPVYTPSSGPTESQARTENAPRE